MTRPVGPTQSGLNEFGTAGDPAVSGTRGTPGVQPASNAPTDEDILKKVGRAGWTVVGRTPETENVSTVDENNRTVTVQKPTGNYVWTITDGKGRNQALTVGGMNASNAGDIVKPPSDLAKDTSQSSDPNNWTDVKRTGTQDVIGKWDPVNNEFHSTPAEPGAKPSGKYENVYVPNADGSQRLVGMTDTGDKAFNPVAADPSTQKRLIQTPTAVYSVGDDDKPTKIIDIDKSSPYQAVVIDGTPYSFDPNEKDPSKRFSQAPGDWKHPPIKDAQGTPMQWDEGEGKYTYPPGVKTATALNVNTTAKELVWYDDQGNEVKRQTNPNYVEPKVDQPNLPPTNTVAPRILVPDPDKPGQFKWIDNEARVTASAALQNIASTLSGHVVDGKMTVDEAKTIIDSANQAMTTATTAANQALDFTSRGAQTGAGLLQQRAATAQGVLSDVLRAGTSRPLYAGVPSGVGEGLVQGISDWTAQMMGGQDTMAAAANMVRSASPGQESPLAAQATSALSQMLSKYKELNGGTPHPAELAHQAAQASAQGGGVVAPVMAAPAAAPAAAAIATPFQAPPAMAPQPPAPNMAAANNLPGQNYGASTGYTGGIAPWNAQPGPSFVAPPTPTITIRMGG